MAPGADTAGPSRWATRSASTGTWISPCRSVAVVDPPARPPWLLVPTRPVDLARGKSCQGRGGCRPGARAAGSRPWSSEPPFRGCVGFLVGGLVPGPLVGVPDLHPATHPGDHHVLAEP